MSEGLANKRCVFNLSGTFSNFRVGLIKRYLEGVFDDYIEKLYNGLLVQYKIEGYHNSLPIHCFIVSVVSQSLFTITVKKSHIHDLRFIPQALEYYLGGKNPLGYSIPFEMPLDDRGFLNQGLVLHDSRFYRCVVKILDTWFCWDDHVVHLIGLEDLRGLPKKGNEDEVSSEV